MELKQYYQSIEKKYGLPSLISIEKEFDLEKIEDGNYLKKIAERIIEKLSKYRHILEDFLHADGNSLAALMEGKNFSEADQNKINSTYKELIIAERSFLLADLDAKEEEFAQFIKETLALWAKVKNPLKELIVKMRSSWKEDIMIREELGYLG